MTDLCAGGTFSGVQAMGAMRLPTIRVWPLMVQVFLRAPMGCCELHFACIVGVV